MQAVEYYAEVLKDGHIPLPQKAMKELYLSKGKKIKVILLSEWSTGLTKENENSKSWAKLEKIGVKITQAWKSEKSGWQLVTEGRR